MGAASRSRGIASNSTPPFDDRIRGRAVILGRLRPLKRVFVKFCTTCGEVYPSDSLACTADGAALKLWTRRAFESGESSDISDLADGGGTPGARTLVQEIHDESAVTDSGLKTGFKSGVNTLGQEEDAKPGTSSTQIKTFVQEEATLEKIDDSVVTPMPRASARGKRQHHTDVGSEVGEHTDVVYVNQPATLPEFDANAPQLRPAGAPGLVVYDDKDVAPFQGMLVSNRYRLESRIGTGGFGVVFDALDKETDRRVAIKILSPALSQDRRALARFRREAIAASRIQHPGIIRIEDFGIEDEGVSYIVMEFLPGCDLAALLEREGKLAPRRAASLIMQCAEALSAAHAAGVLHRDLKPANIFVIEDNGRERVKIIDFGIAKDQSSNPRTADLTSASKVVGTPYYMSPEQARGHELDGRADVYSLGVILFEILTATRPFEAPSVLEILMAHSKAPRVRPSSLVPELASEVALEQAVVKSIQARAKNRFADMAAFASELGRYLSPEAVPAFRAASRAVELDPLVSTTLNVRAPAPPHRKASLAALGSPWPVPLWKVAVPALSVVLILLLLLRSDGKNSDKAQGEAATQAPLPSASASAPVTRKAAAPIAATEDQEHAKMEFAEAEAIDLGSRPAPEGLVKASTGNKGKARVKRKDNPRTAVGTSGKNGSNSDSKAAARKNTRRSQAISEW